MEFVFDPPQVARGLTACNPPPFLRRVGVRGIVDVLSAPGHVGCPSSMIADACLGYSATGYRSSELAFASGGAGRSVSVRLMGQGSKGQTKAKWEVARSAKVGFRSCRATLTHVAVPPLLCAELPRCSEGIRNATLEGIPTAGETQFSGTLVQYGQPLLPRYLGLGRCVLGYGCARPSVIGPFTVSDAA